MSAGSQRQSRDRADAVKNRLRCDAFGCNENHPLEHEALGEECFGTGRWLGWIYLDLNRPDLYERSTECLQWWLEREIATYQRRETALDRALKRPKDEVARKAALDELAAARSARRELDRRR